MGKPLWGGAFEKETAKKILEFNSAENIALDEKLIFYDIIGSIAHVKMLSEQGIIKKDEASGIIDALLKIKKEYEDGKFKLDANLEDVHMNVESAATKLTPHGKKMHTARSRNDQILLDMRLYMRDESLAIISKLVTLQKAFAQLAKKDNTMVAYTHTRVAQPITVSFWCDAFVKSLARDIERLQDCYKRINQNPLGAGAVAGSGWSIDREKTAKLLGFDSVQENALDTITSRGECEAELAFCLATVMMKLSRLCEELIWLSEKKLVDIPEEFTTGSSMMPNKKNADVLELVRGRSARVYSNLIHILVAMKGLMSGYNSDMQETKFAIVQAIGTTKNCLDVTTEIAPKLKFNQEKISEELEEGFAQATEIADALAKKGIAFREAHAIVGKLVSECEKQGITLSKAKPLSQFDEKEWNRLVSFSRERLKVAINQQQMQENEQWAEQQQKKISAAFEQLLKK